ncbi:MAG: hypothetical protein HYU66_02835 [Armatimonadetes bacterium]|nr:hypothetical protein [Armatimonadota bacterium]
MLVRETWVERRPAAEFFRYGQQSPPRAAAVVREAAAHRRAEALAAAGQATADRLAELGEMVGPTLREWLWAGPRRALAVEALGLLGEPQAAATAAELDRVDALLAQRDGSPEAAAELAATARAGSDELRFYLAGTIGQEALAALLAPEP